MTCAARKAIIKISLRSIFHGWLLSTMIGATLALGSSVPTPAASHTSVTDLIRQIGFTPIDMPARDFALRDVDTAGDAPIALTKFKGNWIMLAFWATWCPACNQELPVLESVHVDLAAKGLAVIGVAADSTDPAAIKRHVTQKQITFTILHDPDSQVASTYQASSIPTIYLISPDFRLVGVARGALPLDQPSTLAALGQLVAIKSVPAIAEAGTANGQPADRIALPDTLTPPAIKLRAPPADQLSAGSSIPFLVEVTWKGETGEYLIKVPNLTVPDKVAIGAISATSSSQDGEAKVVYQILLTFKEPGSYAIGPVELSYGPRAGGGMQSVRAPAQTVQIAVRPLYRYGYVGLIIFAIFLLCGAGLWLLWRKKNAGRTRRQLDEAEILSKQKLAGRFEEIRKLKVRGDQHQYNLQLTQFAYQLVMNGKIVEPEWLDLKNFLEKIKYGGYEVDKSQQMRFEQKIRTYLNIDE